MLSYLLYVVVAGGLIFAMPVFPRDAIHKPDPARFFAAETGVDRALLVEDRVDALAYRIKLIETARQSLSIVSFTIDNDDSGSLFYAALLAAGDRGVQIRLLVDGRFHRFRFAGRNTLLALMAHPHVQIRYYEPLNLLKPWTWNNLLHDKYMIVDDRLAMMGGRNIDDRFFREGSDGIVANDRDVIVCNTSDSVRSSVIGQLQDYFESQWTHAFVKEPSVRLTDTAQAEARETTRRLEAWFQSVRPRFAAFLDEETDWAAVTVPTRRITLIHNPIERFSKYPAVWEELLALMALSRERVLYQSPYIIPTWQMRLYLDQAVLDGVDLRLLTNSLATTPNMLAIAGYYKHRSRLQAAASLYEYQGQGSIHGKTMLMDNRISVVGSFNLDSRSTFMSTESMLVIDSEAFASQLEDKIAVLLEQSLPVIDDGYPADLAPSARPVPLHKQLVLGLLVVLVCLFDFFL